MKRTTLDGLDISVCDADEDSYGEDGKEVLIQTDEVDVTIHVGEDQHDDEEAPVAIMDVHVPDDEDGFVARGGEGHDYAYFHKREADE